MVTFIYGVSGSGKSRLIEENIKADIAAGREVYLIVPEQQTYIIERRFCELLPPNAQLSFEVINFTRLANIAERRYGGLSYNYIDRATKSLLMWQTLHELAPLLCEYQSAASSDARIGSLTDMMLSAVGELKAAALTPSKLEHAAKKLPHDSSLYSRLRDISLIWASYSNLVSENYDDPSDDLTHLAELLSEHDLLSNRHIYIDSFTSYTEQEYRVIEQMMRRAPSVTISVGCESPSSDKLHFASIVDASNKLRRLASGGDTRDIILGESLRTSAEDLRLVEKYLWSIDTVIPEDEIAAPENIKVIRAKTPYSEAEAAASVICEALRSGMRCRDIAVIMRDATKWRGIIDAIFDKFGIPYFLSEHTDISSTPLVKLVLSALSIKNRGWRQNDVISLIKTGLCGIPEHDLDIFEDYCSTWNITGKRFLADEWTMNPDGYVTRISERGREILRVANDVRCRVVTPLMRLFTELDAADNTAAQCRALYAYTEEIGVRSSLDSLALSQRDSGDIRAAADTLRLYRVFIDTLDKLASALSKTETDSQLFASALRMIFDNTETGSLPTRCDEVMIGSASLLRADEPKLVIVMGLCEGEFPSDIADGGIFSFTDRLRLSELGLPVVSDSSLRSSDELFFAYRALTAPSEQLVLTYSEASADGSRRTPSNVIGRIKSIFPAITIDDYDSSAPLTRIQTPETALELLPLLGGGVESEVLRQTLAKDEEMSRRIESLETPLSGNACHISPETANSIFGENITLSQSRLESFVVCPFRFYCNYVLGLRESARADFSSNNVGVFIHYVMENFMRRATASGSFSPDLDDTQIEALADSIIEEYSRQLIPADDERGRRMTFLISRLRRIALMLINNIIEEFRHSLFSPAFFELNVDGSAPEFPVPATIETENGLRVALRGVVDRVDLFRRDNDIYIRVIDYKTGTKTYSPDDIPDGIGLQLLLYLFALCRSSSDEFRRAIGCPPDGHVYPAGALYLSANLPVITVDENITPDEIRRRAFESIKRSGPLLDDEDILRAMNDRLDSDFLGTPKSSRSRDNKLSAEGFDALCVTIEDVIGRISAEMLSGDARALPKCHGGSSPCDNCSFSDICRSAKPSPSKFRQ